MIKKPFYKLLTVILAAGIILMMTPITASATVGYNMSNQTDDLMITSGADSHVINGTSTKYRIIVDAPGQTVNILLEGVDIQCSTGSAFEIKAGTVNLSLTGPNTLESGDGYAGLNNGQNNLTITGNAYSSLTAESGSGGAGIGGNEHCPGSNITIHGGTIEAIGWGGAGIGGGYGADGSNILIDGGIITGQGREGAGIGGGYEGNGSNITIDGGTVIADVVKYGGQAAAIGGGSYGSGTNITINKGTVSAKSAAGAGIGGGNGFKFLEAPAVTKGENISIKGGTVTAQGGSDSAGIGASYGGTASGIIIDGGSVKVTAGSKTVSGTNPFDIGSNSAAVTPKNSSGIDVFLVTKDSLSDTEKGYLTGTSYGMTGANAIDGTYYVYIPKYAITYNNTEGATHSNPSEYNVLDSVTLSDAAKSDYKFNGWFDAATGGNKVTGISEGSIGDKMLYAAWLPIPVVESIQTSEAITDMAYGTEKTVSALGLPAKVTLVTDQYSTDAAVTWDVASCSYNLSVTTEQTFTVSGTVALPDGVSNKNSIPLAAKITVTVKAKPAVDKVLQSIVTPAAVTGVVNGAAKTASAFGLPATVQIKTDQGNLNAGVTWDVASCSYDVSVTTEQIFTVSGIVTLPAGVSNKSNIPLTAQITVTVKAKPTVDRVLQSIVTPAAVTGVAHGTAKTVSAFGLPATVQIKTDQGNLNAGVTWDVASCSYDVSVTTAQIFTVSGIVTLPAGVANSNHLPLATRIGVTVNALVSSNSTNNHSHGGNHQNDSNTKRDDDSKKSADNTEKITDAQKHWAKDAITYVTEKKLFSGTGDGHFSPDTSMTRGMMVTVFGRMWSNDNGERNVQATKDEGKFLDVNTNDYYSSYVAWAVENGIASGVGNGQFVPKESVTREQLAVMLYNYARFIKIDVSNSSNSINGYNDSTQISAWAKDAMSWAVSQGLMTGKDSALLDPHGTATRAEVAVILQRFAEKI